MTTTSSSFINLAIRWFLVAVGALALSAALQAQPVFTRPAYYPPQPLPLGDYYSTRPWLRSPNVSPYLLLDDPKPFDDQDEVAGYYLLVRPRLDYNESLRREQSLSLRSKTSWTPYPSQPAFMPNGDRQERSNGSRFMNYGPYYPYLSPTTNYHFHYRSQ